MSTVKGVFFSLIFTGSVQFGGFSQTTAVSFTGNDCSGVNHDFFSEMDAGKIIVLAWVMPCPGCVEGSFAAEEASAAFSSSNPGRVAFYIADDYANTDCHTLDLWMTNGGIASDAVFSDANLSMADYGGAGMPKVIVIAGTDHHVYYNANSLAVTQSGIQTAISEALVASDKEIGSDPISGFSLFPNPAGKEAGIRIASTKEMKAKIVLRNLSGQLITEIFQGKLKVGEQHFSLDLSGLTAGFYLVEYSDENGTRSLRLEVLN